MDSIEVERFLSALIFGLDVSGLFWDGNLLKSLCLDSLEDVEVIEVDRFIPALLFGMGVSSLLWEGNFLE